MVRKSRLKAPTVHPTAYWEILRIAEVTPHKF